MHAQKNHSYGSPAWLVTCTSGLASKSEDLYAFCGRPISWKSMDMMWRQAVFCQIFPECLHLARTIRNWQQSNWTAKILEARSRHCRRPGSHSWRQHRINFPAHNIGLDQPYDTVQQTVVSVLQFHTCYYHVAEITRIYGRKYHKMLGVPPLTGVLRENIVRDIFSVHC